MASISIPGLGYSEKRRTWSVAETSRTIQPHYYKHHIYYQHVVYFPIFEAPIAGQVCEVEINLCNGTYENIVSWPYQYRFPMSGFHLLPEKTGFNNRLIYSFALLGDVYVFDVDARELYQYVVASRYVKLDQVNFSTGELVRGKKYLRKYGAYWDICYDQYRDSYYRFVIHSVADCVFR